MLGHFLHRHSQIAFALGLRAVECVQHALEVFRRWRNMGRDVVVERNTADAVALFAKTGKDFDKVK